MWRFHLIGLLCAAALAGCSSNNLAPGDGAGAVVHNVIKRLKAGRHPDVAPPMTRAELDQVQVALLGASVASRSARARLVRLDASGAYQTWLSTDGISLTFRDGMLTATRGFGGDLISADIAEARALIAAGRSGSATRIHRYLNGEVQIFVRSFVCQVSAPQAEPVEIAERQFETRRVSEHCAGIEQSFENIYWTAPGGLVLKSHQWIGPEIGYIDTELLKP